MRHEVFSKRELLENFFKAEEEHDDEESQFLSSFDEHTQSSLRSPVRAAKMLERLEKRVNWLEVENCQLKQDTSFAQEEIEKEERREEDLINECVQNLGKFHLFVSYRFTNGFNWLQLLQINRLL